MATSSPVPDRLSGSTCSRQCKVGIVCNESHHRRDGLPIGPRLSPQPSTDAGGAPRLLSLQTSWHQRETGCRCHLSGSAANYLLCLQKEGQALIQGFRYLQAWCSLEGAGQGPPHAHTLCPIPSWGRPPTYGTCRADTTQAPRKVCCSQGALP